MSKPTWMRLKQAKKRIESLTYFNQRYQDFIKDSGLLSLYDDYCENGNVTNVAVLMQEQREQATIANKMVDAMGVSNKGLYDAISARDKMINRLLDMVEQPLTKAGNGISE